MAEMTKSNNKKVTSIRKKEFEARLKEVFSLEKIEYVYTPITHKHELSEKVKEEGTFGYHEMESILVDGKPLKLNWIPHIKDATPSILELLFERVEKAIRETMKPKSKPKKKKPKKKTLVDNIKKSLTGLL